MKKKQVDPIIEDVEQIPPDQAEDEDLTVPPPDSVELVEPPEEAIGRLEDELGQVKDQLLRMAAEFDNFRKRTAKERQGMRARAQADLATNVLEALDDLNRVVSLDLAEASTKDVVDGVEMVERKLLQHLELSGLVRVGLQGDKFDPNDHEAIGMISTSLEEDDGMVAQVIQVGYRFGGSLLRPAQVLVHMLQAEEGDA